MIHINGGVINPTFIEQVHLTKASQDRERRYYVQNVNHDGFTHTYYPTDVAVTVRFSSGKEVVYGGIDADTIICWYGILGPEGPAPNKVNQSEE